MTDLFMEEVKEDMRQEQMLRLWTKYKFWMMGGIASILLGTAGFVAWDHWSQKRQVQWANDFAQALELEKEGKIEESETIYRDLSRKSKSFGMLTEWRLVALALKKFQNTSQIEVKQQYLHDAIAALSRLEGSKLEPYYRDFCSLLSAHLLMDSKAQESLDKLEKLQGKDNPWRLLALEAKAVVLNKMGKTAEANGILKEISQENAPQAAQQRVRALLSVFQGAELNKAVQSSPPPQATSQKAPQ